MMTLFFLQLLQIFYIDITTFFVKEEWHKLILLTVQIVFGTLRSEYLMTEIDETKIYRIKLRGRGISYSPYYSHIKS